MAFGALLRAAGLNVDSAWAAPSLLWPDGGAGLPALLDGAGLASVAITLTLGGLSMLLGLTTPVGAALPTAALCLVQYEAVRLVLRLPARSSPTQVVAEETETTPR